MKVKVKKYSYAYKSFHFLFFIQHITEPIITYIKVNYPRNFAQTNYHRIPTKYIINIKF